MQPGAGLRGIATADRFREADATYTMRTTRVPYTLIKQSMVEALRFPRGARLVADGLQRSNDNLRELARIKNEITDGFVPATTKDPGLSHRRSLE